MRYTKSESISGQWLKSADIKSGTRAKLVSETKSQSSSFLNKDGSPKTQEVAKIRIEGQNDPLNVSINRASINALIDAYGEDSKDWQGHILTLETEKVRVAGKSVTALYIIPEGYEKLDDANGYAVIVEKLKTIQQEEPSVDVDVDNIPF